MGLLDNNLVRIKSFTDIVTDSSISVTEGNIKVYSNLESQFASLKVVMSDSSKDMQLYVRANIVSGSFRELPVFNINGDILPAITKSGIYLLDLTGVSDNVYIYSPSAVSGLSVSLSFQQVTEKPSAMSINKIQTIVEDVATLTEGALEKRIALNTNYLKKIFPYFKFVAVNAVYKDSADAKVYKTTFKLSKFDFMDNDTNLWSQDIVSVANRYAIQSEWIPLQSRAMTLIFTFNAASAGDKLYYEVKGIR